MKKFIATIFISCLFAVTSFAAYEPTAVPQELEPDAASSDYTAINIRPHKHPSREAQEKRHCCAICGEPCINVIGFPFTVKETTQLFIFHQNCLETTWKKHPEIWRHFIHTHQCIDFTKLIPKPISMQELHESHGHLPIIDITQFPHCSIEQWLKEESIQDLENELKYTRGCKTFRKASSIGCYVMGALILIAGIVYMIIDCESCRTDCCREENAWDDTTKAKCFFQCKPCLLSMGATIVGAAIMFCGKLIDYCDKCNPATEYGLREDLARLRSLKLEHE